MTEKLQNKTHIKIMKQDHRNINTNLNKYVFISYIYILWNIIMLFVYKSFLFIFVHFNYIHLFYRFDRYCLKYLQLPLVAIFHSSYSSSSLAITLTLSSSSSSSVVVLNTSLLVLKLPFPSLA